MMPAAQADNRFPYAVMSATFRSTRAAPLCTKPGVPTDARPTSCRLARSLVSQDRPEHWGHTNPFYNRLRPKPPARAGWGIRRRDLYGLVEMGIGPAAGPVTMPMHRIGNRERLSRLKDWLCPGCLRREGLYLALTRSDRLRPKVRLVGARLSLTGREIEGARLGGLSAFWGWL